ncbi:MAG: hypothetical protein A2566_02650 [Candidatus Zambryskibacteria bacterium RIFOXYD1_FULL_40_13]|nr:MAG: hypothetical protein UT25_C0002G0153 [Parcubacteria group bacterium GW2011_GWC1_39_12]KKR19347.1 MAG: hypothetical protein UT49_C0002G0193 [Parcubacteria group bacterium GW2011_GWF1_39_37]KKR35270.1 MAG: hypothetical protein UT68_C0004G0078 [Parcubacteria group bacterium GW2011_GWC2_40_10]KKR52297.1 MAG: hypothetical protein UT89_C0002G0098 [Parcubacteria group bacterium GW2011_GWE1_40_20]KKR66267.1 MAG: hypothetical protein UU06_C0003G0017 [Parcubacteria group bacterium GW2011_GWB1_40_
MKKEIGVIGFLVTSFLLTAVAVVMLFAFPYTLIQVLIMLVAAIFGVSALVRSIKEKDNHHILLSIFATVLPIIIFVGLTYLLYQQGKELEIETREAIDDYKLRFPIDNIN